MRLSDCQDLQSHANPNSTHVQHDKSLHPRSCPPFLLATVSPSQTAYSESAQDSMARPRGTTDPRLDPLRHPDCSSKSSMISIRSNSTVRAESTKHTTTPSTSAEAGVRRNTTVVLGGVWGPVSRCIIPMWRILEMRRLSDRRPRIERPGYSQWVPIALGSHVHPWHSKREALNLNLNPLRHSIHPLQLRDSLTIPPIPQHPQDSHWAKIENDNSIAAPESHVEQESSFLVGPTILTTDD